MIQTKSGEVVRIVKFISAGRVLVEAISDRKEFEYKIRDLRETNKGEIASEVQRVMKR